MGRALLYGMFTVVIMFVFSGFSVGFIPIAVGFGLLAFTIFTALYFTDRKNQG